MARRVSLNPNFGDILMNLAADTNGLEAAASLLDGSRRAVESNISGSDRSSVRSRAAGPTTVEDEVRSLFRPRIPSLRLPNHQHQQQSTSQSTSQATSFAMRNFTYGRHNDRRQRRQIQLKCGSGPFVKDLVLIPDPRIELVPRQGVKLKLIQDGFYKQGVHFQKEWSYDQILQKIRDIFCDKLPDSCSLELLHSVHQRLLPPSLEAGQQMTGYFITKICKDKPLYVRTSVGLLSEGNEILQRVSPDVLHTSQSLDSTITELSIPYLAEMSQEFQMADNHSRSASSELVLPCVTHAPEFSHPNTGEVSQTNYTSDIQSRLTPEEQPFSCITEQLHEELTHNQQVESLSEILSKLESRVVTSHKNIVNVHRDNVLDGGFRGFARKNFNSWCELDVKFSGEDGIDAGGPQREFMRLALRAIKELPVFTGPDNAKILVLDYKCLTECTYYKVGQMLAYFIVHRGPCPNFISPTLYSALAEGIASVQPTSDEIFDYELREQVEAIAAASNEEDFKAAVFKAVELINLAGCTSLTLKFTPEGQITLVKSLIKFVVCDRILSPFEQFENGLQTMGLVDEIKKNKQQWKEVFIFSTKPLHALQMDSLFAVKWSAEGSNRRRTEERILVYWRDFLQDLEEGQGEMSLTLKDLLVFTTGADEVPPLGFTFPLQLSFIHPEDLRDEAQRCTAGFPYANTCSMELKIPVLNDYNTFQRNMAAAISMIATFTNQ